MAKKNGSGCPHKWNIETPNGPIGVGKCELCGAVRKFLNYIPDDANPKKALAREKSRRGQVNMRRGKERKHAISSN